jgi:ATP-dependent helicase HepA
MAGHPPAGLNLLKSAATGLTHGRALLLGNGKSRPGFPQRLWYYSRQFVLLHHGAENRVNTQDRPLYGRVKVEFKAAGEIRIYAMDQAPLKRVRFRAGDNIRTQADKEFVIQEVVEKQGLLTYLGERQELPEAQVNDRVSVQGPQERLFAGRFDASATFALRRRTLELLHRLRQSPVRGFVGGRIDLIPHQLYIAQEVAGRHAPRVMLSDEVGLGKTIEACLILHRLVLSGRANRILVLVPESLVHQWFVEMLRRFNIWLHIFDAERCAAIEAGEPGANPFLDDQLVIASIDFLAGDPRRSAQAVAAGWDVLVVDEAHHLE